MKKSLFALAAVGAFAGAAQAQSSVTVYGLLDLGWQGTTQKGVGSSGSINGTTAQFASSAESTSRLGFRGVEDLGGGMQAFFTIETGITPNLNTNSSWNNRQTFLGLRQKGIGQFAIGTQYTPIFNVGANSDPGQYNNLSGNLIYASNAQSGANLNPTLAAYNINSATVTTVTGDNGAFTSRMSNMLSVRSDNIAGFTASGMYIYSGTNQTQTSASVGGANTTSGYGVALEYSYKQLYATAAYQSFRNDYSSTAVTTTSVFGGATGGTNITDNQTYVAATYDFGILKAYAQYVNRKATSTQNSANYGSRSAQQLGVRGYITKTIEGWASAGNGKIQWYGTNEPTARMVGYQLGSNYWLSKRTNLYAIYGLTQTTQTSTTSAAPSNANYAVGMRHTF